MSLNYEIKGRGLIVRLGPEIDHHQAESIRKKLDALIEFYELKVLIFDFSDTIFMDSSGIGVIMGRYKKMKELSGEVGLIHLNKQIERILKLSGIFRLVKSYENEQEAFKRLG